VYQIIEKPVEELVTKRKSLLEKRRKRKIPDTVNHQIHRNVFDSSLPRNERIAAANLRHLALNVFSLLIFYCDKSEIYFELNLAVAAFSMMIPLFLQLDKSATSSDIDFYRTSLTVCKLIIPTSNF